MMVQNLLAAVGCAAASPFDPAVSHSQILSSGSASTGGEPMMIHVAETWQPVQTDGLLQA